MSKKYNFKITAFNKFLIFLFRSTSAFLRSMSFPRDCNSSEYFFLYLRIFSEAIPYKLLQHADRVLFANFCAFRDTALEKFQIRLAGRKETCHQYKPLTRCETLIFRGRHSKNPGVYLVYGKKDVYTPHLAFIQLSYLLNISAGRTMGFSARF